MGCRSTAEPEVIEGPWDGPAMRVEQDARQRRVVMEAPTPGWQLTLDQVRKRFERSDVYVTARRPDPTMAYPQVIVELAAGTGVSPGEAVRVHARVVETRPPAIGRQDLNRVLGPYRVVGEFAAAIAEASAGGGR